MGHITPEPLLVTQKITQDGFQGLYLSGHPGNPQRPNQIFFLSVVLELQIWPILIFIELLPPIIDCVDDPPRNGVLSPIFPYEDAHSLQAK